MTAASLLLAILSISALDPRVETFLAKPEQGLKPVPKGFRIIALSNLAEYCASRGDERCLEQLVSLARSRWVAPPQHEDNGLYDTHLNIVLGEYERAAKDGKYRALNERISKNLARKMRASKTAHIASYPGTGARWPADQAATLFSLHLFDRNFGEDLSAEPVQKYLAWMKANATDEKSGLPRSEITNRYETSKYPRGCALSFTVRYLAPVVPEDARLLWQSYKKHYQVDRGIVVGFREYPEGIDHAADVDSGPIIQGIGTAASGLAIGAAKATGDTVTYARLLASAKIAQNFVPDLGILALSIDLASREL